MNKVPSGTPYQRAKPGITGGEDETSTPAAGASTSATSTSAARWRGSPYEVSYLPEGGTALPTTATSSTSLTSSANRPPSPEPYPTIFTLFTTTDLRILRVSPACYALTGYPPQEFLHLSLFDWLHPADRHLIEVERNRLLAPPPGGVPYPYASAQTDRETASAIASPHHGERELMVPSEGMREPYPNQNVRIIRSDSQFSYYNVRLHLGGAFGGSVWRSDSLSRLYLVVSCLILPPHAQPLPKPTPTSIASGPPSNLPPPLAPMPPTASMPLDPALRDRRPPPIQTHSSYGPPTPVTPNVPGHPPFQSLPSFSSIAAAADAPPMPLSMSASQRYDPSFAPASSSASGSGSASGSYYSHPMRPNPAMYYPPPHPHSTAYLPNRPPHTSGYNLPVDRRSPTSSSANPNPGMYRPTALSIPMPQTAAATHTTANASMTTPVGLPTPVSSHYPYPPSQHYFPSIEANPPPGRVEYYSTPGVGPAPGPGSSREDDWRRSSAAQPPPLPSLAVPLISPADMTERSGSVPPGPPSSSERGIGNETSQSGSQSQNHSHHDSPVPPKEFDPQRQKHSQHPHQQQQQHHHLITPTTATPGRSPGDASDGNGAGVGRAGQQQQSGDYNRRPWES